MRISMYRLIKDGQIQMHEIENNCHTSHRVTGDRITYICPVKTPSVSFNTHTCSPSDYKKGLMCLIIFGSACFIYTHTRTL